MLEEIGVPFDNIQLSLDDQEHKTPEYLAINPMGRMPALVHHGTVVTETAAIVTYLAETFPDSHLSVPPGTPERGEFLRWLFFAPVTAEPSVMWVALGKVETETDYLPFANINDVADKIEPAITGKAYLVDERFTAADLMLGATYSGGRNCCQFCLSDLKSNAIGVLCLQGQPGKPINLL